MQLKWPMLWNFFSLFPAYAGVILDRVHKGLNNLALPRIRGGDPNCEPVTARKRSSSPHTRG